MKPVTMTEGPPPDSKSMALYHSSKTSLLWSLRDAGNYFTTGPSLKGYNTRTDTVAVFVERLQSTEWDRKESPFKGVPVTRHNKLIAQIMVK